MELNLKSWNTQTYAEYLEYLKSLGDKDYKDFNSKITPNSDSEIIGVRVPKLRECAKSIAKGNFREFIKAADDTAKIRSLSHEEITVYGLVIGYAKLPFGEMCERIRRYSLLVNNWACCDVPVSSFKQIRKLREEYKIEIYGLLHSQNLWQQRVGVIILLGHYLGEEKDAAYALDCVNKLSSSEYYVQMAQAWLIATAFAKHRDLTKKFMENDFSLPDEVRKMTVRKLCDSYRVSEEDKLWAKQWK